MGISGTWVNASAVRVMNTGCDRHLIALVYVQNGLEMYNISPEEISDLHKRGVYFRKGSTNRNNTVNVEEIARSKMVKY